MRAGTTPSRGSSCRTSALDQLRLGLDEASARPAMPALFTSRSIRGWRSSTRAATASTAARSETSQASCSSASGAAPRESPTTCQPRARSSRQSAAPIPDDAPVTTATRTRDVQSRRQMRFEGKRGLVLGVANRRSIAWAIAQRLAEEGATLAFTFQGERIEGNVRELAETVSSPLVTACDVRSDEDIARVFAETAEAFGGELDLLVHSVAFAAAEDLEGRFTDTPRERFWMALDVSAYSLVACARAAEPLMEAAGGGSIVTMTYLGGERAVPALQRDGRRQGDARLERPLPRLGPRARRTSASTPSRPARSGRSPPARSPASRRWRRSSRSARRSTATIEAADVAGAAAYLLGDDARNVTGTTLYVDSGYHAMGM